MVKYHADATSQQETSSRDSQSTADPVSSEFLVEVWVREPCGDRRHRWALRATGCKTV